jgi:hypothetical protein
VPVKKPVVLIFSALLVLCGLYLSATLLVDVASERAIQFIRAEAGRCGVDMKNLAYDDTLLVLPGRIHWSGVSVTAKFGKQSLLPPGEDVEVNIEEVVLAAESLWKSSFLIQLKGVTVTLPGRDEKAESRFTEKHYLVKGKKAEIRFSLDLLPPGEVVSQARDIAASLLDLLKSGKSSLPVTFSGMVSLPLDNEVFHARITVENNEGLSVLKMEEEDVILISRRLGLETNLTADEVKLISVNPMKAHRLFRIRTYAREESRRAHRKDRAVPEDAYRHVLWSYLLSKAFGEGFAKKVTDAHETGRTGNTSEERLMDLKNNRIGSRYARAGYGEDELPRLVMKDPAVVREPEQIGR